MPSQVVGQILGLGCLVIAAAVYILAPASWPVALVCAVFGIGLFVFWTALWERAQLEDRLGLERRLREDLSRLEERIGALERARDGE